MTRLGPGPFCSTLLGDLGAEVIKVYEARPERRGGPVLFLFPDSPNFPGWRNCKTMGLDLKAQKGRDIFYELARTADVITEGFRPGVVKRLGVDYETISKINPRIVYASLTAYGQDGPYRDLAGHDINSISVAGFLGTLRPPGGAPIVPRLPVADFAGGGMCAALGILAALMGRDKIGKGQYVDVSMTDAIVEMMMGLLLPALLGGVSEKGDTSTIGEQPRPFYDVYETKDGGYISIASVEPWFYANLCQLLGHEDFIEHQYAEGEKREEISRCFKETFLTKTRDEWLEILRRKDTCASPVYALEEVFSDPHLLARKMIVELDHPTLGRAKQIGSMIKLSESPLQARNWSQRFGQHTDELLLELGYDKMRIDQLREAEVIG